MEAKKTEQLGSAGRSAAALRILYVGTILPGSTAVQRADALKDLGHQVTTLSTENSNEIVVKPSLPSRVRRRIVGPQDRVGANAGILRAMRSETFDVLWIDKGLTVHADTLRQVRELQPRCRIIGFSLDDMMNAANQSRHYLDEIVRTGAVAEIVRCQECLKKSDELRGHVRFHMSHRLLHQSAFDEFVKPASPIVKADQVPFGGGAGGWC